MAIYYSIDDLPQFANPVITIGTFDGVHMGHKVILKEVHNYGRKIGGETVLLTFEPHPRKLIFPDTPIEILTPLDKKVGLISNEGIQHIVVVPFTKDFAAQSAQQYVSDFLVKLFHPSVIIIGYDHQFGHDRKGDISLLRDMQKDYGYEVVEIPAQLIDEAAVSSTKIRKALKSGAVSEATAMLGRNYSILGTVQKGVQLGRTIGYPTANVVPNHKEQIIPANGVYAVKITYAGNEYNAMLNIGFRPTVSNDMTLHIEAFIFDFSDDIYNEEIELSFVERLRDEQKFASLDELKAQLAKDEVAAKKSLGIS